MSRVVLLASLVLSAACFDDDVEQPDPADCPAEPFEQCGWFNDGAVQVSCENNIVFADDLTISVYCYPNSTEEACEVNDRSLTPIHECTTACNGESRFFDFHGDYMNFDPAELCEP